MSWEIKDYYHFKDGLNVELVHLSNNMNAAEKAMLNAYRRTSKDIAHRHGGKPSPGLAYVTFDGTKFH